MEKQFVWKSNSNRKITQIEKQFKMKNKPRH